MVLARGSSTDEFVSRASIWLPAVNSRAGSLLSIYDSRGSAAKMIGSVGQRLEHPGNLYVRAGERETVQVLRRDPFSRTFLQRGGTAVTGGTDVNVKRVPPVR